MSVESMHIALNNFLHNVGHTKSRTIFKNIGINQESDFFFSI